MTRIKERPSMAEVFKSFSDDVRTLNPELMAHLGVSAENRSAFDEALKADSPKRGNKYGAQKVTIGEHTFDSRKEARRYLVLREQEERGEIKSLLLQCEIILMEGFTYKGEKVRPIRYTADFVYQKEGNTYVEDVKSEATAKTEAFRIRWRLLQWMYRDVENVILVLT